MTKKNAYSEATRSTKAEIRANVTRRLNKEGWTSWMQIKRLSVREGTMRRMVHSETRRREPQGAELEAIGLKRANMTAPMMTRRGRIVGGQSDVRRWSRDGFGTYAVSPLKCKAPYSN